MSSNAPILILGARVTGLFLARTMLNERNIPFAIYSFLLEAVLRAGTLLFACLYASSLEIVAVELQKLPQKTATDPRLGSHCLIGICAYYACPGEQHFDTGKLCGAPIVLIERW